MAPDPMDTGQNGSPTKGKNPPPNTVWNTVGRNGKHNGSPQKSILKQTTIKPAVTTMVNKSTTTTVANGQPIIQTNNNQPTDVEFKGAKLRLSAKTLSDLNGRLEDIVTETDEIINKSMTKQHPGVQPLLSYLSVIKHRLGDSVQVISPKTQEVITEHTFISKPCSATDWNKLFDGHALKRRTRSYNLQITVWFKVADPIRSSQDIKSKLMDHDDLRRLKIYHEPLKGGIRGTNCSMAVWITEQNPTSLNRKEFEQMVNTHITKFVNKHPDKNRSMLSELVTDWNGDPNIPPVLVVIDNPFIGNGHNRITTKAVSLMIKSTHRLFLQSLVTQPEFTLQKDYWFIPYKLSENKQEYRELINGQENYLATTRVINIAGITRRNMTTIQDELLAVSGVYDLWATPEIERLGLWAITVEANISNFTLNNIDTIVSQAPRDQKFAHAPRRTRNSTSRLFNDQYVANVYKRGVPLNITIPTSTSASTGTPTNRSINAWRKKPALQVDTSTAGSPSAYTVQVPQDEIATLQESFEDLKSGISNQITTTFNEKMGEKMDNLLQARMDANQDDRNKQILAYTQSLIAPQIQKSQEQTQQLITANNQTLVALFNQKIEEKHQQLETKLLAQFQTQFDNIRQDMQDIQNSNISTIALVNQQQQQMEAIKRSINLTTSNINSSGTPSTQSTATTSTLSESTDKKRKVAISSTQESANYNPGDPPDQRSPTKTSPTMDMSMENDQSFETQTHYDSDNTIETQVQTQLFPSLDTSDIADMQQE